MNVQFGIGSAPSIGSITIRTPVGDIEFHVVKADPPFLLCLADMDTLKVYYNNLTNKLITPTKTVPVVRRFGHPSMLCDESLRKYLTDSLNQSLCLLTATELRRLHRRIRHPAADRLQTYRVLERSGHEDVDKGVIDRLTKYFSHCQRHGKSPCLALSVVYPKASFVIPFPEPNSISKQPLSQL